MFYIEYNRLVCIINRNIICACKSKENEMIIGWDKIIWNIHIHKKTELSRPIKIEKTYLRLIIEKQMFEYDENNDLSTVK